MRKKYFGSGLKIFTLLFVSAFLLLSLPLTTFAAWTIETADGPKYFSNFYSRAIAVDRVTNQPHIAYGGNQLSAYKLRTIILLKTAP
jgi:hypothetical protein